ncbi:MAG: hypothetical protein ACFE8L_00170 [Candidatus Hodarchaeota archaeon]
MRPSRVFRWIIRILILVLTLSVTAVSLLGGYSAILILSDQDNIGIDTDNADFNLDYNETTGVVNDINFTLPFNITNAGFFDLEDLTLGLQIGLEYWHVNLTGPGINDTQTVKIFEKSTSYPTIKKGSTLYGNYTGVYSDFVPYLGNLPDIADIDLFKVPIFRFFANFTISLTYSLGLHSITLGVNNITIGEYP